jgi:hypothetical protein
MSAMTKALGGSLRLLALIAAVAFAAPPLAAQESSGHEHHAARKMTGLFGPYAMSREGSGTAWQPDSTPHEGLHVMTGDWMVMAHGFASGVFDRQSGPRGTDKAFSASMLMLMAQRPLWDGTLGLRGMISLDPAMGAEGYPLLLQTGETADGRTHLTDRQHPHDLFMELAASYSHPLGEDSSLFGYFGLPGEPALGPSTFMHRFSGMEIAEAPITHHWLDSTHITFGVATLGYVWRSVKLEGSTFRGREPDQYRWDMEAPRFDSYAGRLSWNPGRDLALQVSYGRVVSPEQLEPAVDAGRLTASASWNWRATGRAAQTTFAFGQNQNRPGRKLDAFLLETTVKLDGAHSIFGRVERVDKSELFHEGPLEGRAFVVNKASLGYLYDFAQWRRTQWGVGALASAYAIPAELKPSYGGTPTSFMLFARVKII